MPISFIFNGNAFLIRCRPQSAYGKNSRGAIKLFSKKGVPHMFFIVLKDVILIALFVIAIGLFIYDCIVDEVWPLVMAIVLATLFLIVAILY